MNGRPVVSIILLNWNQYELTAACIESLGCATYRAQEVIVVDQASGDGSGLRLQEQYPGVRVLFSPKNLGFTGGNNLGMRYSNGKYILLLNNDTEVHPNFLEPLVRQFEEDEKIGAASPKIRYFDQPGRIQYAGGPDVVDLAFGRNSWKGWNEQDFGQHDLARETTIAHGAAFFVRRSVMEEVGGLDDTFFIFYEEIDWSLRIRRAGLKIAYIPGSVILHKESMTVKKDTPFRLYYMTANRLLLSRKHSAAGARWLFLIYFLMASAPVNLFRFAARKRFDLVRAFVTGAWRGMTVEPMSLAPRAA